MTAPAPLESRVAQVVARVVMQATGRLVAPSAEDRLFEGLLRESNLGDLALALQEEFDVALAPAEINGRALATIRQIARILAPRVPPGDSSS